MMLNSIPDNDKLNDFMLSEYTNIAEAHFKTNETVSEFLKHYVAVISIPITALVVILNIDSARTSAVGTFKNFLFFVAILFGIVSFVGAMILWHIINLRMDAILYARTINGIRKHFYDQDNCLDVATKIRLRGLPQSPLLPAYREFSFFGPLVLVFALLNTLYFYFAYAALVFSIGAVNPFKQYALIILTSLYFTFHIGMYLFLARYREDAYLRSNILGIDIDGVLNQHQKQFCQFLCRNTGKEITEEQITAIPVHECPGLGVTRDDEKLVFNDPKYWTEMPAMEQATDTINRLRSSMRLKIHIFTHRPWPITVDLSRADKKTIDRVWANAAKTYSLKVRRNKPWWYHLSSWLKNIAQGLPYKALRLRTLSLRQNWIDRITKTWLEEHGFQYDKIMIEKGSDDAVDPSSHIVNRFYACRMKMIKYFVEDDLVKAKKLAFICDVVFLLDHSYNRTDQLPANVIRVQSWDEIRRYMRDIW